MATYNKRGYKPKNTKEETKVEETHSTTKDVFESLDQGASKTEDFIANNQKVILGVIGVVVVAALGFFLYQEFVQKPKVEEASKEMFYAQQYFNEAVNSTAKDSLYNLALNGANGKFGLLDIIDEYSGTPSANLAQYSAGMAYLNMGKYKEAIEHLQKFDSDDPMLGALALGGIGDAFVQLNQDADALGYYEKAANYNDNEFTAPRYLYKAGITATNLKEYDKALKYFNKIKEDYSSSEEARTIDIYIGKVESLK
ncbi:tol-pal system YbgF family protein [Zhouia sp. PK063]|uniref:tol-pal system YbgF family protein n=1 Tax=Zhouia sp. PK063 TaxID=3373602 RepID=UPI0037AC0CFF